MRSMRQPLWEMWPFLAIVTGLVSVATCLADNWPPSEDPTTTEAACYAYSGYCDGWETGCYFREDGLLDAEFFKCPGSDTVWEALQVNKGRIWGQCEGNEGTCTYYEKYYCIRIGVYKLNADCDLISPAFCYYDHYAKDLCEPQ
jgi:hypothetical protein